MIPFIQEPYLIEQQFTLGAIQYQWKALLDKSDVELILIDHAVE